jgi:hypothetical protein
LKTLLRFLLAGLALGASAGCESDSMPLERIDSRIELRLHDSSKPPATEFELRGATEFDYPDLCYTLPVRVERGRGAFALHFLGVSHPTSGACATALGPATCTVSLGALRDGDYALALMVNGTTTRATLQVRSDSLRVVGGEGPWTTFPEPAIPRVH